MINSSSDNVKKLNSINRRMFITGSLKFFVMIGIVSRLFFLQVKENKKYLTLSDKNRIREWKLAPVRGEFHDYFGNVIAGNFEAYQLHVIPEQVEDFRYVIYRIKDLLELTEREFKKILKKKNEILQMKILDPNLIILDETDSGLDIDALKIISDGVNSSRSEKKSFLVITHYQRLLEYIKPDHVHVLSDGKIIKSGTSELALELEKKGYKKLN